MGMTKRKEEKKKSQVDQAEAGAEETEQLDKQELLAKLQRVSADFLNYQKRMARNDEELRLWVKADFIKKLLPIVDDLEQALEAGKNGNNMESLLAGFRLVYEHLQDMLAKQQVETIETKGQKFDPAIHEAMLQQESAEHGAGTVVAELRKGYSMDGRTLRPARVSVSKAAAESDSEPQTNNQ